MIYLNRFWDKIVNLYQKHLFVIQLAAVILVSIAVFLGGLFVLGDNVSYKSYFVSSQTGNLTEVMRNGDILEQEFSVEESGIQGVAVYFATYETTVTSGFVSAKIYDSDEMVVYEDTLEASDIRDNAYLNLDVDSELAKGMYTLQIMFEGIDGQSIACWLSDDNVYEEHQLKINGSENTADLTLCQINGDRDIFSYSYIMIMILFILLVSVAYVLVYKRNTGIHKIYLMTGLFLGILYMLIIPVYVVPDEPQHLYSAYAVSNNLMGIENSSDGTILMRKDDAENTLTHAGINRNYYNTYFAELTNFFVDEKELVQTDKKPATACAHLYLPSAIGLTLGRVLGFGTVAAFLCGRMVNMLLFVLATYYAIKKIPFGKTIVFLWALLPMTLQQASSYSYDSIVFALSVVVISLSINLAYADTEKTKKSEWITLLACVLLLVPAKSLALLPVCVLPVIIYFKKYQEGKKIRNYVLLVLGVIVIAALGLKLGLVPVIDGRVTGGQDGVIVWANEPGYTISYLLTHPGRLFELLFNTIYYKGDFYFETFLGNSLGWFEIGIPLFAILPYFVMMLIAGMKKKNEPLYMSRKMKIFVCMLAVMGMGFACAGMLLSWTPMSYNWIEGVQGRYFLPFAILLFLSVRSNKVEVAEDVDKKLVFSGIWLEMIVFLFIARAM